MRTDTTHQTIKPMSAENKKFLEEQLEQARGACWLRIRYDGEHVHILDGFRNTAGEKIPTGRPYQQAMAYQQWANQQRSLKQVLADLRACPIEIKQVFADGSGGYTSYY